MSDAGPLAWVRRLGRALEATLLPPVCGGCGRRGAWLCPTCAARLRPARGGRCACGSPRSRGRGCSICADWPVGLGPIRAAYAFDGPLRASIHRFKYRGERARGRYLGGLLADFAQEALRAPPPDLILPVPLHPRRRRERGFNQAEVLAEAVGQRLAVPLGHDLLRIVDTRAQVGLDYAGRRANMQGAFRCGAAVRGVSVLLIDDVVTTGATMEAAGLALLDAGALQVRGLALARGS